jgi:PAS domain S-box-containing protein
MKKNPANNAVSPMEPTLRQQAEAKFQGNETLIQQTLSLDETRRMLHELQVHQIELELQNDELRRAQEELEKARERYFDLYNLAPVGYCTISEKGLILEANLTVANLLGQTRSAFTRQPFTRFIFKEDQDIYYLHRKMLFETGISQACELRMLKKDKTPFWAHLDAAAAQDAVGAPVCRITISDISERKQAEEALRESLAEKETLLKEVHHRVKNNLASIASLISLQKDTQTTPEVLAEFDELSGRIRAMSLVHELLYQSETLSRINLGDYFGMLMGYLHDSYDPSHQIYLRIHADGVEMDLDHAISCGLIVNELLTNAFKHAFPEGKPRPGQSGCEVTVTAVWDGSSYTLTISDNGIGFPVGLDWATSESLGLRLVMLLGQRQLGGKVELDGSAGTTFRLCFAPKQNIKK